MFEIGGKYVKCEELSTGIINSTYHVKYIRDGLEKNYIVQRINKSVFKNPPKLMENIVRVTEYVRNNIKKMNLSTKRFVLRAFLTKDTKEPYYIDEHGEYWRVYRFISDSITYDSVDDLAIIEKTGQAFGRFANCLDGFDANCLHVTIPDFHNTPKRYEAFENAVLEDKFGRAKSLSDEVEFLHSVKEKVSTIQIYLEQEKLPLRVTHNDTKTNNVAIDVNTGEALSVLDLDTVMPGAIAFDFGDAIRFIANTCNEDDPNVENVQLNLEKYRAFAKGFVGELKDSLTELEKNTLNLGVLTMTVELAVRFLTDYINGDVYFKTKYPGHNLDRARNQIALSKRILENFTRMDEIIKEFI